MADRTCTYMPGMYVCMYVCMHVCVYWHVQMCIMLMLVYTPIHCWCICRYMGQSVRETDSKRTEGQRCKSAYFWRSFSRCVFGPRLSRL